MWRETTPLMEWYPQYCFVMENQSPRKAERRATSHTCDDGTLLELVFDPLQKKTAFAVSEPGETRTEETFETGAETLVPYSPENNLILHGAVLLPSHAEPFNSLEQLRVDITAFIHRYLDLTPVFEKIATEYVLLSWVYDAFNELPYLRFQGDYGTGKTRALMVIGSIAYRPFFASGASTVSPIFHTLDAFRGTLVFDEADFRMSDEKAELVKILNNGTVRGVPVLRTLMNQKKEFNPAAFHVFGPKIVATRSTYDDKALESRFLTETMGGRKLRADIPINLPSQFHEEALHLRNRLLSYRFSEFHRVRLNPELVDLSLEPRQNQVLVPLLSITDDTETRDAIRSAMRVSGLSLTAERSVSVEGELLGVVLALFNEHQDGSLPLRLVRQAFIDAHGSEYERPISTKYLISVLRKRLAIRVQKTVGVMVIPRYEEPRVREMAARFGIELATLAISGELGRKNASGGVLPPGISSV